MLDVAAQQQQRPDDEDRDDAEDHGAYSAIVWPS
jgi:hypothetical protein